MAPSDAPVASHSFVSARAVRAAIGAFRSLGLDVDRLLDEVEIEPDDLSDPDEPIPYAKLLQLWLAALRDSGDEYLGIHSAERIELGDYEILGYIVRTSPTVGDLLAALHRYQRLLADAIEIQPSLEGELVRIRYTVPGYQLPRPIAEYVLGVVVVLARFALQEELVPREVCFTHAAPIELEPYRALFRSPLRFDAGEDSVLLDVRLDRKLESADPDLHRILRRHADRLIADRGGDPFVCEVSRFIEEAILSGRIGSGQGGEALDVETVARGLGVTARTLRRRLSERGTSLSEITDVLRREVAMHHLLSSRLGVGEIGFLLGFSEPSAFHRAFKRWTDLTPAAFRAQALA